MSKKNGVLVVGDALMDNQYYVEALPKVGEDVKIIDYCKNTGGSAANTAVSLASCGVKTFFCGSVGDDEDGRYFLGHMKDSSVDTTLVQQIGATGFTVTIIDSAGERTMLSYRGASASEMQISQKLTSMIDEVELVLLSGYYLLSQSELLLEIASAAKNNGTVVALDPSPIVGNVDKDILRKMLEFTDVLLPNESETAAIIETIGTIDVACVATKLGDKGAKMIYHGKEYIFPAKKIEAVDTTGAGDAFNAGFLASMLSNDEPQDWLTKGNEMAANIVAKKGAV